MRIFLSLLLLVIGSPKVYARTSVPMTEVVRAISELQPTYKETGLSFGFISIESCLYVSHKVAVLKNYCFPKKDYLAKGYTILSPSLGVLEIYEEKTGNGKYQKTIRIKAFPEELIKVFDGEVSELKISQTNDILDTLYYQWGPACWSTNHSASTEQPESKCYKENIAQHSDWVTDSMGYIQSQKSWDEMMRQIEASLK